MPILNSTVPLLKKLTIPNSPVFTESRFPFFPNDVWDYGWSSLRVNDNNRIFYLDGLLPGSGGENFMFANAGTDSYGPYGGTTTATTLNDEYEDSIPFEVFQYTGNLDCRFYLELRMNETANFRFFIGLISIAITGSPNFTTDDFLGEQTAEGFGLIVQEDGNFRITSNDGSATSNITGDIDAIDTNVHTFYFESDSANSRWGYSWDGSTITYITTKIPTATTPLNIQFILKNLEVDVDKTFKLYDLKCMQKRKL